MKMKNRGTLDKRGMGAMEMLAGHLKGSGAFVARTLAFSSCAFELKDDIMTRQGERIYDDAATFWIKLVRKKKNTALFVMHFLMQLKRLFSPTKMHCDF